MAWQLPNTADALLVFMALSVLGACQSPLLAGFRERELTAVLGASKPEILIAPTTWRGTDHLDLGQRIVKKLGITTKMVDVAEVTTFDLPLDVPVSLGTNARYFYATSGSTGSPKLVRHTGLSLLSGSLAQSKILDLGPRDVNAWIASVAHIGGPVAVAQSLASGNTIFMVDRFQRGETSVRLRERGVTVISAAPATLGELTDEQSTNPQTRLIPKLRLCISGAAPKPPDLHRRIQELLGGRGIMMGYGMTECGSIGVPSPLDTDEQLESTVGKTIPGMRVDIVDEAGTPVRPGQIGEIRVAGPMVCEGYLDEQQTREALDEGGRLITGDLGYLRDDLHLCVTGRIKDLIIRKGENISPKEIEDVLYGMPALAEVAVVGLPDDVLGERVCAVVTVKPDHDAPDLDGVVGYCRSSGLMMQKTPQQLVVQDDFPRTALGKINKVALKEDLGAVRS